MKPFLSVIIPAYNEAKRLPLTLVDINRHISKFNFPYEIIVVNDGSRDETADVVKRFAHLIPNLRLIDNKDNHGKGRVVRQGMLSAKGELRIFTDADNSTSIDQFQKLRPYFSDQSGEKYDIVFGSRDIEGAKLEPPQPWYRRLLGDIGNLIIQALLLPGIRDTQCGFKCFTARAAEQIFNISKINRFGFDPEALALAKKLGYKIKEIPIVWVNDPRSAVGLKSYLSVFWDVLRVRWWLWTNKYDL
jgi:dolichyl-phosphate beta-glucosyltransferase